MKYVYLPLEIKFREIEARLRTAVYLLRMGCSVMIGQQWSLFRNADVLPKGVFLIKTVNKIQANVMADLKRHGFAVAAMDEEALCCVGEGCFLSAFSPKAAENCDLFFAQSTAQRDILKARFPDMPVKVVGNPRGQRSEARLKSIHTDAQNIKDQYGDFVLFNTNYGMVNSHWGSVDAIEDISKQAGTYNADMFEKLRDWEQTNLDQMVSLLDWTVENANQKIVIRIHPGEDAQFWVDKYGDKAHVEARSNPIPWIKAANLVVHTRCTTGLEAVLMDVPALNLEPIPHPEADTCLPEANYTVRSWEDGAKALREFFDTDGGAIREFKPNITEQFSNANAPELAAKELAKLAEYKDAPKPDWVRGYKRAQRAEILMDKCTIHPEEFIKELQITADDFGLAMEVLELDESLFILEPQHG